MSPQDIETELRPNERKGAAMVMAFGVAAGSAVIWLELDPERVKDV